MSDEHQRLLKLMIRKPEDYQPWGQLERWKDPQQAYPDCSSGCRFARWLEDFGTEYLSMDWCVCANPKSHRAGLLTFEHQGCQAYELDPELDAEEDAEAAAAIDEDAADPLVAELMQKADQLLTAADRIERRRPCRTRRALK